MTDIQAEQTAQRFLDDVAEHEMQVLHDDGLYRHLSFRRPWDSSYWFSLHTTPGTLMIHGDMGSYAFARLDDMFRFFAGTAINPVYWSEKLIAIDRGGFKHYSRESFERQVSAWIAELVDEDKTLSLLPKAVDDHLAIYDLDSEHEARAALRDFEQNVFTDAWEWDFSEFTFHFLWCCHAIQWGIERYRAEG